MDEKKILRNVVVCSLFLGNCVLCAKTQAISNQMTDDFWLKDLGLSLRDMAFFKRPKEVWLDGKLYWTVQLGNKSLVKHLLTKGIDVNTLLKGDQTVLHHAVLISTGMMRLLLDNGANPNLKDDEGYSSLHVAGIRASKKMVDLLVDYGADPNSRNKKGYTPLIQTVYAILFETSWQKRKGRRPRSFRIPRYLSPKARLYAGKNDSGPPKASHYFLVMRALVNRGAVPNAQDNEGNTALHLAVSPPNGILYIKCPSLELLEELVKLGVDVNIRNKKGETVLDLVQKRKEG
jgi:ankyrin repeat protein